GAILAVVADELAAASDQRDPLLAFGLVRGFDEVAGRDFAHVVAHVREDAVAVLGTVVHGDDDIITIFEFGELIERAPDVRVVVDVGGEDGVAAEAGVVVDVVPAGVVRVFR